jgi:transposase
MKRAAGLDTWKMQYELVVMPIILNIVKLLAYRCPDCGEIHRGKLPETLVGLLGPKLVTFLVYLKGIGHISVSGLQNILGTFGLKVSRGFICKILDKGSEALGKAYEEVMEALPGQKVLHIDETSHKENGRTLWTWVFRAVDFAFFCIKVDRSASVIVDMLGRAFKGIICCDYYSAYQKFLRMFPDVKAQFCLAHLKRDLKFLAEWLNDPKLSQYGQKLLDILGELFGQTKLYRTLKTPGGANDPDDPDLTDEAREAKAQETLEKMKLLGQKLKEAALDAPDNKKAQNIAKRFSKWPEDFYLTFLTIDGLNLDIEMTNNPAEQTVRTVVIDRHVTQGTRSPKGRTRCERIWTIIGSCAIQKRSAYDFIKKCVLAHCCGIGEYPSLIFKDKNSTWSCAHPDQ